ncbi:MAG: LAGLIDADG family homing endonuclease [Candidatus Aenigmatarchaeota archaeon]
MNFGGNSVTGDQEILIEINGQLKRVCIGDFIDSYIDVYGSKRTDEKDIVILDNIGQNSKCFTIDDELNVKLTKIDALIRHKISEPIFEVTTDEGRSIKITGDHNVFMLSDDGILTDIPINMLKENETYIAVPRILPYCKQEELKELDITPSINKFFYKRIKDGYLYIHNHPEIRIPVNFPITDELLQIAGIWLADGNYDREGSSNIELACGNEPECMTIIDKFTENFNINYRVRSDGIAVRIVSKVLGKIFKTSLGLTGNSYTKRIPDWVFNLSDRQIGLVLKGYMSGDGGITGKQIRWTSVSKGLLDDIQTLLIRLGINSTIFRENYGSKSSSYNSSLGYSLHGLISSKNDTEFFINRVGFLQDFKNKAVIENWKTLKMYEMHRIPNIKLLKKWGIKSKTWYKHNSIKSYIVLSQLDKIKDVFEKEKIKQICIGGTKFLKIKSIKKIDISDVYVYDISTKPFERFVCSNILVHNTDFSNMLSRERLKSKKKSKTQSVQSSLPVPLEPDKIHIGPSDYVPWLKDRKIAFIRLEGEKFGGAPIELELRLSVEDSPNSGGCVIDAIRCCKLALDRKVGGALLSSSSYFMKSPPQQFPDTLAREMLEQFIKNERER